MWKQIIDFLSDSDNASLFATLSSLGLVGFGWIMKFIFDFVQLSWKLKRTYKFQQKTKINETYSESITYLLKSSEDLNYRLWNFHRNIDKEWHTIPEDEWNREDHYYFRSFVYRFLRFLYHLKRAEESVYHFDLEQSSKRQKKYFRSIKTLRNFFCDRALFVDIVNITSDDFHFYNDYLDKYIDYVVDESGSLITLTDFEAKLKNGYKEIYKVLHYINKIVSEKNCPSYAVIREFHLFLMMFLNTFGHEYQKTSRRKLKNICDEYSDVGNKKCFVKFLERNKSLKDSHRLVKWLGVERKEIKTWRKEQNEGESLEKRKIENSK